MAVIDIRIRSLAQLFDAMDPAPFHDKALDPAAEEYILSCARDQGAHEPVTLRLHAPESLRAHASEISSAIRTHFRLSLESAVRLGRQRARVGHTTLTLGIAVLVVCLVLRSLIPPHSTAILGAVEEGLLILGWVALWRPVEILLFERWENRKERQHLLMLSNASVEFAAEAGADGSVNDSIEATSREPSAQPRSADESRPAGSTRSQSGAI